MKREGGQVQLKGRMLDRHVEIRESEEDDVLDTFSLTGGGTQTSKDIAVDGLSEVTVYVRMDSAAAAGDLVAAVSLWRMTNIGNLQQVPDQVTPYESNAAAQLLGGNAWQVMRLKTGGCSKITVHITNNNAAAKNIHVSYSGIN